MVYAWSGRFKARKAASARKSAAGGCDRSDSVVIDLAVIHGIVLIPQLVTVSGIE